MTVRPAPGRGLPSTQGQSLNDNRYMDSELPIRDAGIKAE